MIITNLILNFKLFDFKTNTTFITKRFILTWIFKINNYYSFLVRTMLCLNKKI